MAYSFRSLGDLRLSICKNMILPRNKNFKGTFFLALLLILFSSKVIFVETLEKTRLKKFLVDLVFVLIFVYKKEKAT